MLVKLSSNLSSSRQINLRKQMISHWMLACGAVAAVHHFKRLCSTCPSELATFRLSIFFYFWGVKCFFPRRGRHARTGAWLYFFQFREWSSQRKTFSVNITTHGLKPALKKRTENTVRRHEHVDAIASTLPPFCSVTVLLICCPLLWIRIPKLVFLPYTCLYGLR